MQPGKWPRGETCWICELCFSSGRNSAPGAELEHPHQPNPAGLLPSHPAWDLLFPAGPEHLHTSQSCSTAPSSLPPAGRQRFPRAQGAAEGFIDFPS